MIRMTLLFLIFSLHAMAQDYQREINDQVWKPFIETFNHYKTDQFLALHSKDVFRCSRESKEILNWDQYYQNQKHWDEKAIKEGSKRSLELRFTERIANAGQAIEVGIYKSTSTNSKGESQTGYGKFMVVLRKQNGVWRIVVDTDSSEGGTINEKHFLEAKPLD